MGERENAELIDDNRDVVGPWNAYGTNNIDSGNLRVTVLHVEDDETIAAMAKEMLEEQGWRVETCADGNGALQKISGETDYDLLLVDYKLPDVNGLALVRRARQLAHRSQIPIIVLSATPVEAEPAKLERMCFCISRWMLIRSWKQSLAC